MSDTKTITFPQSKFRDPNKPAVVSAVGFAIGNTLWVYCLTHRVWDRHGVSPKCKVHEADGTFFWLDETEPGTMTGRKPHHKHDGEYWIECRGYAPLEMRKTISAKNHPKNPVVKSRKKFAKFIVKWMNSASGQ